MMIGIMIMKRGKFKKQYQFAKIKRQKEKEEEEDEKEEEECKQQYNNGYMMDQNKMIQKQPLEI